MAYRKIKAGSTSVIETGFAVDLTKTSTNDPGLAIAYNTAGLLAKYKRSGDSSWTSITLVTATAGTWTSGGLAVATGGQTGDFELHVPNAAFAAGAQRVWIEIYGAANMQPVKWSYELDAVDYQDSVRLGLTALPNVAQGNSGQLATGDASGRVDLGKWLGTAVTLDANNAPNVSTKYVGGTLQTARDLGLAPAFLRVNTAQAGASTTITLDSGASATDSLYKGASVTILSGTGAGQSGRVITAYVGSTKVATVTPAWITNPASDSVFALVPAGVNLQAWIDTAPLALSSQQVQAVVPVTQKVDVETIKTQSLTAAAPITFGAYVGGTGAAALAANLTGDPYAYLTTNMGALGANLTAADDAVMARLGAPAGASIAADIATRAPSSTALSTAQWTNARAAQLDNLSNLDAAISSLNNLSALVNLYGSPLLEIPDSSSTLFAFTLVVRDNEGKLVDLDSSPTITAANAAGTDRSANLSSVSHPATGRYTFTYSVASTAAEESLRITCSGTVSSEARYIEWIGAVVNYDSLTTMAAIKAQTDKLTFDGSNNIKSYLADRAHGGTSTVLTLERLIAASTTSNEPAFKLTGNGTAPGMLNIGGDQGPGMKNQGGATSGYGMYNVAMGGNFAGQYSQGHGSGAGARFEGGDSGNGLSLVSSAAAALAMSGVDDASVWTINMEDARAVLANGLLDLADGIETGLTLRQATRGIAAKSFGVLSGAGSGTEVIKGAGVATTRLTASVDSSGNITAWTLNL